MSRSSSRAVLQGAAARVPVLLQQLTRIKPGKHRVVSCYLKLEPRDRARGKYLVKLKNRAKALLAELPRLGLDRAAIDAVTADVHRVLDHLRLPASLPASQGVAVFACAGLDLFETCPLPVVYRSRLSVDRTPLVKELASVEDEFGRLLAVLMDRTGARFFEVTAFGVEELAGLRADSTRGGRFRGDQDGPGWGEHSYHNRIREEKQRHAEAIARQLFALDRKRPVHGILLGGVGGEARLVAPHLHPYLAGRVIGTLKLSPKEASPAEVHAAVLEGRALWERAQERVLAERVQEALGTGWGVNGIGPTLRALARGQVRSLLVHADAMQPGFRGTATGRLALTERELKDEGPVEPVVDVVDEALEEALRQHVDVNVVYDADASASLAGLAALLRFK